MGIAMGLCMLSYYNAYGYLLMSAVFFAGCMMKCGEQKWDWQQLLKKGCLMLGNRLSCGRMVVYPERNPV